MTVLSVARLVVDLVKNPSNTKYVIIGHITTVGPTDFDDCGDYFICPNCETDDDVE